MNLHSEKYRDGEKIIHTVTQGRLPLAKEKGVHLGHIILS